MVAETIVVASAASVAPGSVEQNIVPTEQCMFPVQMNKQRSSDLETKDYEVLLGGVGHEREASGTRLRRESVLRVVQ